MRDCGHHELPRLGLWRRRFRCRVFQDVRCKGWKWYRPYRPRQLATDRLLLATRLLARVHRRLQTTLRGGPCAARGRREEGPRHTATTPEQEGRAGLHPRTRGRYLTGHPHGERRARLTHPWGLARSLPQRRAARIRRLQETNSGTAPRVIDFFTRPSLSFRNFLRFLTDSFFYQLVFLGIGEFNGRCNVCASCLKVGLQVSPGLNDLVHIVGHGDLIDQGPLNDLLHYIVPCLMRPWRASLRHVVQLVRDRVQEHRWWVYIFFLPLYIVLPVDNVEV